MRHVALRASCLTRRASTNGLGDGFVIASARRDAWCSRRARCRALLLADVIRAGASTSEEAVSTSGIAVEMPGGYVGPAAAFAPRDRAYRATSGSEASAMPGGFVHHASHHDTSSARRTSRTLPVVCSNTTTNPDAESADSVRIFAAVVTMSLATTRRTSRSRSSGDAPYSHKLFRISNDA